MLLAVSILLTVSIFLLQAYFKESKADQDYLKVIDRPTKKEGCQRCPESSTHP